MKTQITTLFLFSLLFFTVSCENQKPQPEPEPQRQLPINIAGNLSDLTKVTNNAYENGDKVGLYVVNQTSAGVSGTLANSGNQVDNMDFAFSGSSWTPRQTVYWKDDVTNADFYCYQPFTSSVSSVSTHSFTVQNDQSNAANFKASDFTWGKSEAIIPTSSAISIQTRHVMSNILIYIAAGTGFTPQDIENATKSITFYAKVSSSINLATGEVNANGTMSPLSPKVENGYYSLIIPPQAICEADNVMIEITLNGQLYQLYKTSSFVSGKQHTLTATLNRDGTGTITVGLSDWETGEEIRLDGSQHNISKNGGQVSVKVTSSANYTVDIPAAYQSWITPNATKAATTKTLDFEIRPNNDALNREGEVIFRSADNGAVIETIKIQQASATAAKIHVEIPGTLGYLIDDDLLPNLKTLTVTGNLSADDFYFMRDMLKQLEAVDLYETSITIIPPFAFCLDDITGAPIKLYYSTKLKTIRFPKKLRAIGVNAFRLAKFEELELPEGLIDLGNGAFSRNNSLLKIKFPNSLRTTSNSIANFNRSDSLGGAFANCAKLQTVIIPEGISEIGYGTFMKCTELKSIDIPSSIKLLYQAAFRGCSKLETITFAPNSELTTVGYYISSSHSHSGSFENCSSLNSITLTTTVVLQIHGSSGSSLFSGANPTKILKVPASIVNTYKADTFWKEAFNNGNNIQSL